MSTKDTVDKFNNIKREPKRHYWADHKFNEILRFKHNETLISQRTPSWVVEDIVKLLPDDVWNPHTKFLDIYSKSGIFLEVIMAELLERADYSGIDGVDATDRKSIIKYIRENQLYAICWRFDFTEFTRSNVWEKTYGGKGNIKFILESSVPSGSHTTSNPIPVSDGTQTIYIRYIQDNPNNVLILHEDELAHTFRLADINRLVGEFS